MPDRNIIIDPVIEMRFRLLEKDISVIQLRQTEIESFVRQAQGLTHKMESLDEKLDSVCEAVEKIEEKEASLADKLLGFGKVILNILLILALIIAAANGVKIPGIS